MSRFIDADALVKGLYDIYIKTGNEGVQVLMRCLQGFPTVDAVQVVRCKDCKYLSMTTLGMDYACWHGATKVYGETGKECDYTVCQRIDNPDHYCSYGERKADAGV